MHGVARCQEAVQTQLCSAFARLRMWCCSVPREVCIQHEISPDCAYHLASTCWANGRLEIIPSFASAEANNGSQPASSDVLFDPNNVQPHGAEAALTMTGGSMFQTNIV